MTGYPWCLYCVECVGFCDTGKNNFKVVADDMVIGDTQFMGETYTQDIVLDYFNLYVHKSPTYTILPAGYLATA